MDGVTLALDTWLAAEDNILVVTVTSKGTSPVELVAQTWARANSPSYPATAGVSGDTAWAQRSTASGTNWLSTAALATRVLGADSVQAPMVKGATASTVFTLRPGQTATIVTAVSGGGKNPGGVQTDAVRAAGAQNGRTLSTLATKHAHWWKRYWLASSIDIGNPVLEKYYYAAQYFIGSASRPGKVAPGLYGVWTTTDQAGRHGDIHLNYNAQAPFYGVYSSNRPELALPFHDVILDYVPEAQRRTQGEEGGASRDGREGGVGPGSGSTWSVRAGLGSAWAGTLSACAPTSSSGSTVTTRASLRTPPAGHGWRPTTPGVNARPGGGRRTPRERDLAGQVWRVLTGPPAPGAFEPGADDDPLVWWGLAHAGTVAVTVPILVEYAAVPASSTLPAALVACCDAHAVVKPWCEAVDADMSRRPPEHPASAWEQAWVSPSSALYEDLLLLSEARVALIGLCTIVMDPPT
ncbi:glycosyl hydrolase family 95 catalytic domain-containing protein [Embleya sp. NBC_00888]|uniref:glycosyl hydrolase family 95 catalytic domain-containing protein n=1 Tax=Embleya sp. NBC_00888 TaxID=2975960 RepID=UPI00386B0018